MRLVVVALALTLCASVARGDTTVPTPPAPGSDATAELAARRWLRTVADGTWPRELREVPRGVDRSALRRYAAVVLRGDPALTVFAYAVDDQTADGRVLVDADAGTFEGADVACNSGHWWRLFRLSMRPSPTGWRVEEATLVEEPLSEDPC